MPPPTLRLLIVEESADLGLQIVDVLESDGFEVSSRTVRGVSPLQEALLSGEWDLVLAEFEMSWSSTEDVLAIVKGLGGSVPVLIVSQEIEEEVAIRLFRDGASDVLLRHNLARLPAAVRREMRATAARQEHARVSGSAIDLGRRLNATFEHAPVGIFNVAPDGAIVYANRRFCAIVGRTPEELESMRFPDLAVPEDRARFSWMMTDGNDEYLTEGRLLRKNNKEFSVSLSSAPVRDGVGGIGYFATVVFDISERKALEFAIRERDRHLQLLMQSTTQGVFGVDAQGLCTFVNRAACDALGFSSEEMIGSNMHSLIHHSRQDGSPYEDSLCPIQLTIVDGAACELQEDLLWKKNGESFPIDFSAAPMMDGDRVQGAVVVFNDISERKLLQSQLQQIDRLRSLGSLAATIAHEFNNVLMGIQPFAELLVRKTNPENVQRSSQHILQAVQRGRRVTQEILRFTKPAEPLAEPIDLALWLQSLEPSLRAILGAEIRFEIRVGVADTIVRADPHQLAQVFTNLATNARDAMSSGGVFSILAEHCMSGTSFPFGTLRTIDRYFHIKVTDTGGGMSAETLSHVFDPFFTTKRTGTGLGLAVVHQIIQLHGGSIFAESSEGRGTSFHIFLPLIDELPGVASEATSSRSGGSRVGSVLIVEDDEVVAEGLSALFAEEGITADVASTGAAAIAFVSVGSPDVVILDLGLPDMDGRAVYERISAIRPELAVIFASGSDDAESLAPYLSKNERVRSLLKPYEFESLLELIASLESGAVG